MGEHDIDRDWLDWSLIQFHSTVLSSLHPHLYLSAIFWRYITKNNLIKVERYIAISHSARHSASKHPLYCDIYSLFCHEPNLPLTYNGVRVEQEYTDKYRKTHPYTIDHQIEWEYSIRCLRFEIIFEKLDIFHAARPPIGYSVKRKENEHSDSGDRRCRTLFLTIREQKGCGCECWSLNSKD